jgi:hypothetical protein
MLGGKHEDSMADSKLLCCFCGKEIERSHSDPCVIRVVTSNHEDQLWACHGACFKEKLAKEPPVFEPVYF